MNDITVVTDSSACIPLNLASDLGIDVLPIPVHAGDEMLFDDDTAASIVYTRLENGEETKTSPVSAASYLRAMAEGSERGVIVVTPASELSVMCRNASRAADLLSRPVEVIDSRTAAAAQGLIAVEAANAAQDGWEMTEVVATTKSAIRRAHVVAAVDLFGVLRSSGRVAPNLLPFDKSASGGGLVFGFGNGTVSRVGPYERFSGAIEMMIDAWRARGGDDGGGTILFHAAAQEKAEALAARLDVVDRVVEFSAALGVHTGPGVVGIGWLSPARARG